MQQQLVNVETIHGSWGAFGALLADQTVVCWGCLVVIPVISQGNMFIRRNLYQQGEDRNGQRAGVRQDGVPETGRKGGGQW